MSGHQVAKCDLCSDRLAAAQDGQDIVPRCVAACPSGALLFADERNPDELNINIVGGRSAAGHLFKRR